MFPFYIASYLTVYINHEITNSENYDNTARKVRLILIVTVRIQNTNFTSVFFFCLCVCVCVCDGQDAVRRAVLYDDISRIYDCNRFYGLLQNQSSNNAS